MYRILQLKNLLQKKQANKRYQFLLFLCFGFFLLFQSQLALGQCPTGTCSICNVQASVSGVTNATINTGISNIPGSTTAGGIGVGSPLDLTAQGCGSVGLTVTISFNWEVGSNINWLHGIAFSSSPGWTVAQGNNPGADWLFQNSIVGDCSGAAYGAGFYFDGDTGTSGCQGPNTPGDASNGWGIPPGQCCPVFSFALEFCPLSGGNITEAITFTITDDGETGSWSQPGGCVFDITIPITFNSAGTDLPENGIVGPVCEGEPVTLNAGTGCNQYIWSDGQSGPVIQVAPLGNTTYCVTTSSGSAGCQTVACVDVLTETCCAAMAGTVMVNPPNPCPGSTIAVNASGYNTDLIYTQTVFLADDAGNIIDVSFSDAGNFTLPPTCSNYTAYTYNFASGSQFPLTGTNVSSLDCSIACCELIGIPVMAQDLQAPIFPAGPPNTTVACPTDVPPMDMLQWTDNCDIAGTVAGIESGSLDNCNGGMLTRIWEYTDMCGNLGQHIQFITVTPLPQTIFPNPPPDMPINCGDPLPPLLDLDYTNNVTGTCADMGVLPGIMDDQSDPCNGGVITYTWSGIDNCGNPLMHVQTFTVQPAQPPIFPNLPVDMVVDCGTPLPPLVNLPYDNLLTGGCADSGALPGIMDDQTNGCNGGLITYTWSGIDNCGNPLMHVQTFTVQPSQPAMILNPPVDMPINCGDILPPLLDLQYDNLLTGSCADAGTITGIMDDQSDPCNGGLITYTWTGIDACGNQLMHVQTFTVQPSQPPMLTNPPFDMVINCGDPLPILLDLDYDNNLPGACNIAGTISGIQSGMEDPCGSVVTYTWTGVDNCGNTLNHSQNITIQPADPAIIINPPVDMVIECGEPLPPLTDLMFDNLVPGDCANVGTLVGTQSGMEDPCGSVVIYTWSGADNCGNPLNHIQTITVNPAPPAMLTNPPVDMVIECGDLFPPLADLTFDNFIPGNCANSGTIPGFQAGFEDPCGSVITYTWSGVDNCGNPLNHVQVITVNPAPPATFMNPPVDEFIICGDPMPALAPLTFDNGILGGCQNTGQVVGNQTGFVDPCGSVVTYNWIGVDNCGNPLDHTQTITIDPAPPATFMNPPADIFINCGDLMPPLLPLTFDNGLIGECQNTGQVGGIQAGIVDPCVGGVIQYIWSGIDNCGNPVEHTQTIDVAPAPPAMFMNPPMDLFLTCQDPLPPLLPLSFENGFLGACENSGFISPIQSGIIDPCVGGTILYSWIGADNCGNPLEHIQTIEVSPADAPIIVNAPFDLTVNCGDPLPPISDLLYDNNAFGQCQITGTVPGIQQGIVDACFGGELIYLWDGFDVCGNNILHTQTITVLPAPPADFLFAPFDLTINCGDFLPPPTDLQFDNGLVGQCQNTGFITGIEDGFVDPCAGGLLMHIWEGADNCGNFLSFTQNITVLPPPPPMFLFTPPDMTVECTGVPPQEDLPYDNGAFGICNITGSVQGYEVDDYGNCPRVIQRFWEYLDPCTGEFIQAQQNVTVDDFIPPIMDFPPPDITICNEEEMPFPETLEWFDNCAAGGFVLSEDFPAGDGIIVRTWTALDDCNNNTIQQQVITISEPQNFEITGSSFICEGDFSELSAIGADFIDYSWSTGESNPVIVATVAGTYEVTVTNQFGCTASASFEVETATPPIADILGETIICDGQSTILTAQGGVNYQWDGQSFFSQTITVDEPGLYTVLVIDNVGCSAAAQINIETADGADVMITGTDSICEGETATLTAAGDGTYAWSTGETGDIISTTDGGDYIVTITNTGGCTGTASFTVNASNNPTPAITGNLAICAGNSTTLDAGSGFDTYTWSDGTSSQTLDVTTTGTYIVTVTNLAGCSGTNQVNVIASDNPTVTIAGSITFCAGNSTTLDAGSGFSTYAWSNGMSSSSIMVNATDDYSVTVTDMNGCTGTDMVSVMEGTSLNPGISGNLAFCTGESTILDVGSGFDSYMWSDGTSNQTITPAMGGTYTVTVSDASGCTGEASVVVVESDNPVVDLGTAQSICDGENALLDAGDGFTNYEWSNGTFNQTLSVSEVGTYIVTVTNANGCTGTDSIDVGVSSATEPTITGILDFCSGQSTDLDAGGGYAAYNWSNGGTGQNITVSTGGTFIVTVTDAGGCTASNQVVVIENTISTPTISGVTGICSGESANLDAGSGYNTYNWSNGDVTQTIAPTMGGMYSVTVTSDGGCTAVNSIMVDESPNPTPSITGDNAFCAGETAMIDAGSGFDSYLWSNNNTNQTINVSQDGTYTVTVSNASGCTGTAQFEITESAAPMPAITGTLDFCDGQTSLLDAGAGFDNYEWSNGDLTQTTEIDATGIYTVTVTNAGGCMATTQVSVTENTANAVNITGSTTFCTGSSSLLGVDNTFASYQWSTGETTASISVNTTETFMVTVTDINGCTATNLIEVEESLSLMPAITGPLEFCQSNSTTLDAGGGFNTYTWSNGLTTQTIDVTASGNYAVTVSDESGCSGSDVVMVAEINELTPVINGTPSFCPTESTTLDVAAGFETYTWSNGATNNSISVDTPDLYEVTVTDANGCTGVTQIMVEELIPPVVNIGEDQIICIGESSILIPDGTFFSYEWSTGSTSSSINVAESDAYILTVTDANGCVGTDEMSLTVIDLEDPSISGAIDFCFEDNTTLDAGAGYDNYMWSSGETTQMITASGSQLYAVTVSNDIGCEETTSVITNELDDVIPMISGSSTFCTGTFATLDAGAGYDTYLWSNGETMQIIEVNSEANYSVTVTTSDGCMGEDALMVMESDQLEPNIVGILEFCAEETTTLDAGGGFDTYLWSNGETTQTIEVDNSDDYAVTVSDLSGCTGSSEVTTAQSDALATTITGTLQFCAGEMTTLDAGAGFDNYFWSTGEITQTIDVNNSDDYSVTVSNTIGCEATAAVTTNEVTEVVTTITGSSTFCSGTSATLDAGADFDTYLWSNGETTQTIQVNTQDTYSVTVTTVEGCSGEDAFDVMESDQLEPNIAGILEFCADETTTLDAGGGFDTYLWSNGETTQTIEVDNSDDYTVTVTDATGCSGEDQVTTAQSAAVATTITGILEFCEGDMTTLDAGAGFDSYLWSNTETTQIITVDNSFDFTVTVTNALGCAATASATTEEVAELVVEIAGSLSFCTGFSTTLDAGAGFDTYLWSNGETTPSIEVNDSDDYSVTVTNVAGCSGTTAVTTSESDALTPSIVGTTLICAGDMTTLDAGTSFQTYLWSNGETTSSIDVTDAGMYSVTVSANGCEGETQTEVSVETPPVAGLAVNTNQCEGDDTPIDLTQLVTGGDANGVWTATNSTTGLNEMTGSFDPTGQTAGTYSFQYTVEAEAACTDAAVLLDVEIQPLPTVAISGVTELTCTDNEGELSALGSTSGADVSYAWTTTDGAIVGGANQETITVGSQGTYTLTVDWNGCTTFDTYTVTSNDVIPVANTIPPAPIDCQNTTTGLIGTSNIANAQYLWTGPNGFTSNEPNPTVDVDGEYTLVVINPDNDCTSSPSNITVVDNSNNPNAVIAGSASPLGFDCVLASIILEATGALSNGENAVYQWYFQDTDSPISKANAITYEALQVGTYFLEVIDTLSGCTDVTSIELPDLTTYPIVDVLQATQLDCNNSQVNVIGDVIGNSLVYDWQSPDGNIVSGGDTEQITVDQSGWYYFTATDNSNGCANVDSMFVDANFDLPTADAGSDAILACDENEIALNGSASNSATGAALDYVWTGPALLNNTNAANPSVSGAGTYSLTVIDQGNGCEDVATVNVTEPPMPNVGAVNVIGTGCADIVDGSIAVEGVLNGTPPYLYSIDGGTFGSSSEFNFLAGGDYTIAIMDANGCQTDTTVTVEQGGTVEVDLGTDLFVNPTDETQLMIQTNIPESEIAEIIWTPSTGLSCSDCPNPTAMVSSETMYSVTVISTSGCEDSDAIVLRVEVEVNIYVPSAFSPNDDMINDVLTIFTSDQIESVNLFRVYDRWGNHVYEAYDFAPNDTNFGWDGTYRGQALDPAVFVWYAEITMPSGRVEVFKGDVAIMR